MLFYLLPVISYQVWPVATAPDPVAAGEGPEPGQWGILGGTEAKCALELWMWKGGKAVDIHRLGDGSQPTNPLTIISYISRKWGFSFFSAAFSFLSLMDILGLYFIIFSTPLQAVNFIKAKLHWQPLHFRYWAFKITQNIEEITVTGVKTVILTQLEERDVLINLWATPSFLKGQIMKWLSC